MIEQPPLHNDLLNSAEWSFWLHKMAGSLPAAQIRTTVLKDIGTFTTNGGRKTVATVTMTEDAQKLVIRWIIPAADFVNMPSIIVKNGVDVLTLSYPNKYGWSVYGLSNLVSGDVIKIDVNYATSGVTHPYEYEVEYLSLEPDYAGSNNYPPPKYDNEDKRWYGYWNGIYTIIGGISSANPRTVNYTECSTNLYNLVAGVEQTILSITAECSGNVYINNSAYVNVSGFNQNGTWKLYRDGSLLATYTASSGNRRRQRRAYHDNVVKGTHTYDLKITPAATVSSTRLTGIDIYVLA